MACSCQTSCLRVVIRSLTQLSVAETRVSTQHFLAAGAALSHSTTPPAVAFHRGPQRNFHSEPTGRDGIWQDEQPWSIERDPPPSMLRDQATLFSSEPAQDAEPNSSVDGASEPTGPYRLMSRPPAANAEEFVQRLKKALRRAKRYEKIAVPFDPTDEKKQEMAEEHAKQMTLKAKEEKTELKYEAKKEAGEEMEWWRKHKIAMKKRFPEGWNPRKKLSPDAMEGIRVLHQQFPTIYTTPVLAEKFGISPEGIRRILKSKWRQKAANTEELATRWTERGMRVWTQMAAFGMNPPTKWEKLGVERDMLQVGQRDAQEGNRRGRYWEKKAAQMQEQYSNRFRRNTRLGVQQPRAEDIRELALNKGLPHAMDDTEEEAGVLPGKLSKML